jgi:transposase
MAEETHYVRRKQGDYSLTFKMQLVRQIEQGQLSITSARKLHGIQSHGTVLNWLRKYGSFDWENQTPSNMPKSPEQKVMELEAKVKLLEKQKAFLEQQAHVSASKAIIFDMMINLAEKEYQIDIRKNSPPEQSNNLPKKNTKH